ncbi:MAG: hypothetical protein AAF739_13950 [Pseudomonadota bacterium]
MATDRTGSSGGSARRPAPGEVYLELTTVDKALRVAAIDSLTGAEVIFTAPANAPRHRIEAVAIAKLERRLALDSGSRSDRPEDPDDGEGMRRGRLV